MSFTDQKPRVATEQECNARWGGRKGGFRCHLCGHTFKVGDTWRWVYAAAKAGQNFFTCASCDGPDVAVRFKASYDEAKRRFWWLFHDLAAANEEVSREARVSFEYGKQEGYDEGLREGKESSLW